MRFANRSMSNKYAEHRFTNLLNDRLMIPLAVCKVGVLYVKRNGAVLPQRSCFRFAVLSSLQRGNCVKQIVKLPALNLSVSTGLMLSGKNIQL